MTAIRHKDKSGADILLSVLRDPAQAVVLGDAAWDLLLRLSRRTRLLGRLAVIMEEKGLLEQLPARVIGHFTAARVAVSHRQGMVHWEVNRILQALGDTAMPLILLKGSAYLLAGLPASRGRLQSDVDLLVPADSLASVEDTLLARGWQTGKLEDYDQHYYRTWMHELPPLLHPERGMEVDIHHTISPLTSRLHPDPDILFHESIPLADERLRVLQPVDMVLHSAVHLFYDGEFINGLRDLVDLADLFDYFGRHADFWEQLVDRAHRQGLLRPLFYALRYAERLLAVDIPASAMQGAGRGAPPVFVTALMDRLVERVLLPDHPDFPQRRTALAQWLLYVRSHWLRMPPGLLVRHLLRKQFMRWKNRRATTTVPLQGN